MDLSGVLSDKVAELWQTSLFTCLQREAPPGYKAVTVNQIMEADKRLWVLLSERTRGNVASKLGSPPPCDAEFTKLADSQEILSFPAPLPLPPPVPDFVRPRFEPYLIQRAKGKAKEKARSPTRALTQQPSTSLKGRRRRQRMGSRCVLHSTVEILALQEDQARQALSQRLPQMLDLSS